MSLVLLAFLLLLSPHALAGVSAVAVVPAVDGVFAVTSFPADLGIHMLSWLVSLYTALYNETYIYRPSN